jgi:DNA-binding CsgD family transcriptional regulator
MSIRQAAMFCPGLRRSRVQPAERYTSKKRRVLERALLNESDAAIADALGISRNAVLKTWRGIYERVDRRLPQLVPKGRATDGRGQEKRRHLLLYLRGHLEELRPGRRKNGENGGAAKAQRRAPTSRSSMA